MNDVKEGDLALVPVALSLARSEIIDFAGHFGGDYTSIIGKYPMKKVSFSSTVDVFSYQVSDIYTSILFTSIKLFHVLLQVWTGFGIGFILFTLFMWLVLSTKHRYFSKSIGHRLKNLSDILVFLSATMTAQGINTR